jgi:predicted amidophosphoribosyltransferase
MKTTEIPVYCWQCGKRFYIEITNGFCGGCNKETDARWERFGKRLLVSCEECGMTIIEDENRFDMEEK